MSTATVLQRVKAIINHPAGPLTIHFWAPTFKWALVFASLSDLRKSPDMISTNQNLALGATGVIWARYATQITPVNWNLFTVNFFVGLTSIYQLYRKWAHAQQRTENKVLTEETSDEKSS